VEFVRENPGEPVPEDKDVVSTGDQIAAIPLTMSVFIASLFESYLWASRITSCRSFGDS